MFRLKQRDLVKVVFHNGQSESGRLVEYTKEYLFIETIDKQIVIINDPYKNILMIKTIAEETDRSSVRESVFVELEPEIPDLTKKNDLRNKTLGELHKLRAQAERERVKELLTKNTLSEIPEVNFGTPDFTKPIPKCAPKKIRRSDI
jgi:hypothetical protein